MKVRQHGRLERNTRKGRNQLETANEIRMFQLVPPFPCIRLLAGMHERAPTRAPVRVRSLFDQNPLTFSRPPVTVLPARDAVGTALLRMAALIVAAVEPAWYAR